MQTELDILKSTSVAIRAERIAYNDAVKAQADKIAALSQILAEIEKKFGATHEKTVAARAAVREAKQERARIKPPARFDALPEVEAYKTANPNAKQIESPVADIRRGETPLAAHKRRQDITDAILTRIRGIETAPADPDEACGPLFEQIDELAKQGAPRIVNGRLVFPKTVAGTTTVDHAVATLAFLMRDTMKSAAKSLLTADGPTMTAQERAVALDKAVIELTEALRQEAACAMAAEVAGQRVERRRNVHPAIILSCAVAPARVYGHLKNGGRA